MLSRKFSFRLAAVTLLLAIIIAGCAPRIQKPARLCRGAESAGESLKKLQIQAQRAVSLKANGSCVAKFSIDGKKSTEHFLVKIWVNPPYQVRLQGDVAFNAKGIDLGSNEDEFWLSMKPKEIGNSYYWGRWSQQNASETIVFNPKTLLEALGMAAVDSNENDTENWLFSSQGSLDILTKQDAGIESQKIYISNCDYLVERIEYFDSYGKVAVLTKLDKYEKLSDGFFVPTMITIVSYIDDGIENSFSINLKSIEPVNFDTRKQEVYFTRPMPRQFEHIYKIVDGNAIEEQ